MKPNAVTTVVNPALPALTPALTRRIEMMKRLMECGVVGEPLPPSQELREEARQTLAAAEAALEPAPRELAEKWLATLGVLTSGRLSVTDARVKLAAYSKLLDHPIHCYTEETLAQAARRFTWFPSFAEVAAFLDEVARAARDVVRGLRHIAEGPAERTLKPGEKLIRDMDDAEREKFFYCQRERWGLVAPDDTTPEEFKPQLRPRKPGVHQLAAAALPPEERPEYWRKAMEEKPQEPGGS